MQFAGTTYSGAPATSATTQQAAGTAFHIVGSAAAVLLLTSVCAVASDASKPAEPQTDFHGDPLPGGAVSRLGTVRYRLSPGWFLSDSRTMFGAAGGRLVWMDATTGLVTRAVALEVSGQPLALTRDRDAAAVRTYRPPSDGQDAVNQIVIVDTATGEVKSRLSIDADWPSPWCAAFTPDASRLATGDRDGKARVRVWNLATGQVEASATPPSFVKARRATNHGIESLAFSPDGKWLVITSSSDVSRWRWQTDEPMERMGSEIAYRTCEFVPGSAIVAVAGPPIVRTTGPSPSIRFFDVPQGRQMHGIHPPEGEAFSLRRLAFTSDGSLLTVPTTRADLTVWNVKTGELERTLPTHFLGLRTWAHSAIVSPDDRLVAAGHSGQVGIWDFQTGRRLGEERVGHLHRIRSLSASPEGTQILTAGAEGLAIVWEAASGRPVHVWRNPRSAETPVNGTEFLAGAFSPDGRWIASSTREELVLRHRKSGEVVHVWPGHPGPWDRAALRFSPDSRTLNSFGADWFLRTFDVQSGKPASQHAIRPAGIELKERPDGSVEPEILHMGSMSAIAPSPMKAAELTPDGRTLVLLGSRKLHLFDVETGEERASYDIGRTNRRLIRSVTEDENLEWADDQAAEFHRAVAISPDSRLLAIVGIRAATQETREYELRIRNLEDGKIINAFPLVGEIGQTTSNPVSALRFSPDSTKLAVAVRFSYYKQPVDVYDVPAGRLEARIDREGFGSFYTVDALAFTPDGDKIVTPQPDATAIVWDWKRFALP